MFGITCVERQANQNVVSKIVLLSSGYFIKTKTDGIIHTELKSCAEFLLAQQVLLM